MASKAAGMATKAQLKEWNDAHSAENSGMHLANLYTVHYDTSDPGYKVARITLRVADLSFNHINHKNVGLTIRAQSGHLGGDRSNAKWYGFSVEYTEDLSYWGEAGRFEFAATLIRKLLKEFKGTGDQDKLTQVFTFLEKLGFERGAQFSDNYGLGGRWLAAGMNEWIPVAKWPHNKAVFSMRSTAPGRAYPVIHRFLATDEPQAIGIAHEWAARQQAADNGLGWGTSELLKDPWEVVRETEVLEAPEFDDEPIV